MPHEAQAKEYQYFNQIKNKLNAFYNYKNIIINQLILNNYHEENYNNNNNLGL